MNGPGVPQPRWFFRRGELTDGPWESLVDERLDGWKYTGLRIAALAPGDVAVLDAGAREEIVIPLAGSFDVDYADPEAGRPVTQGLRGRAGVFSGATDVLYLPSGVAATIRGSGRLAIASAATAEHHPVRYISPPEIPVELRGAGTSSRQIHNFGTAESLDAARLIVCEVITPAGNWSSYPPHKHDTSVPGVESRLEEIYYFEVGVDGGAEGLTGVAAAEPFGMFSTYSSPAGTIDVNAMVRSGDIALVPYGFHGPAVAAPGYHLYYLNVMAGPDPERAWHITDDPAHAWIRDTWRGRHIDPRLPFPNGSNT